MSLDSLFGYLYKSVSIRFLCYKNPRVTKRQRESRTEVTNNNWVIISSDSMFGDLSKSVSVMLVC